MADSEAGHWCFPGPPQGEETDKKITSFFQPGAKRQRVEEEEEVMPAMEVMVAAAEDEDEEEVQVADDV